MHWVTGCETESMLCGSTLAHHNPVAACDEVCALQTPHKQHKPWPCTCKASQTCCTIATSWVGLDCSGLHVALAVADAQLTYGTGTGVAEGLCHDLVM